MHEFSNAVVSEAKSKGLEVQRIITSGKRWDGRSVLIEGRPCQIIRTRYLVSNPRWPKDVSIAIYLPRTEWPDFLIYVACRATTEPPDFYIVPRRILSKDTSLSPHTLGKYQNAWNLLKEKLSSDQTKRRFTILNRKLQDVMTAAKTAGLEVSLIRPAKHRRWPVFLQTLVMVADRRCSLHSFSRINLSGNYVFLRKPKSRRAEFHLYMIPAKEPTVYVFPRRVIKADTSVSLYNEKLKIFKNNWSLLAQSADGTNAIEWKPRILKASKEPPTEIRETIIAAEKHGLLVERQLPDKHQLYISGKRCQVVRAKPVVGTFNPATNTTRTFIPITLPKSDWAEFIIFFSKLDSDTVGRFFIVPRMKIPKRTLVSPTSSWLREHADAWHLLRSEN